MAHKIYKREITELDKVYSYLPNKLNGTNVILSAKTSDEVTKARVHIREAIRILSDVE